jgi:hypothetical protein
MRARRRAETRPLREHLRGLYALLGLSGQEWESGVIWRACGIGEQVATGLGLFRG